MADLLSYEPGDVVCYVDPRGRPRLALVTTWWGEGRSAPGNEPACNLVLVSDDESKKDPYGRQIERETSVVHRSMQGAPGNFWCRTSDNVTLATDIQSEDTTPLVG